MSKIMYKLVYDIIRNWPLFGVFPLCLCNSIGGCISKTGHLGTPVMLGTNKYSSRPTSSWKSSSFPVHQFISILQLRTRRTFATRFLPPSPFARLLSTVLYQCIPSTSCQAFWVRGVHARYLRVPRLPLCAMVAHIDCPVLQWDSKK